MGRHAATEHGGPARAASGFVGRLGEDEHQVEGRGRHDVLREPGRRRRQGVPGHEQRPAAKPGRDGRQGRADVLPRVGRRLPVAGHHRQARDGHGERLARAGRLLIARGRGEAPLLRDEPRRTGVPRHRGIHRWQERRPLPGREAERPDRRRHRLEARHDQGARRLPAQHGQLVAGRVGGPRVRRDVERTRPRTTRRFPLPRRRASSR